MRFPSDNICHSILAGAIEMYFAVFESNQIMRTYTRPERPHDPITPKADEGFGCTEAPRGILWNHFRVDAQQKISYSRIVPPTSQNQAQIERDLKHSLMAFGLEQDEDAIRHYCEMLIRNYDPCISCSTHFLDLRIARGS